MDKEEPYAEKWRKKAAEVSSWFFSEEEESVPELLKGIKKELHMIARMLIFSNIIAIAGNEWINRKGIKWAMKEYCHFDEWMKEAMEELKKEEGGEDEK